MRRIKSLLKKLSQPIGQVAILLLRLAGLLKLRVPPGYLVSAHLIRSGSPLHPNKAIFITALAEFKNSPLQILETGTSAWGADSTRLWDEYVRTSGGQVQTVDIRKEPSEELAAQVSSHTKFTISDSVEFLSNLASQNFTADLIYLDSYDVDWANPTPAEIHGEKEFAIAKKLIRVGGIILIDDTPTQDFAKRMGLNIAAPTIDQPLTIRGKGALALLAIKGDSNFSILSHQYAVAIKRIS